MGFRFRKSITLIPGVRLNISKSGFSTSIGRPGATVNIGKRGIRGTVGLPGSGLSYSEMLVKRGRSRTPDAHSDLSVNDSQARQTGRKLLVVILGLAFAVMLLLFVIGLAGGSGGTSPVGFQPTNALKEPTTDVGASTESRSAEVADNVNCRANPNARARIVSVLSEDDKLAVVDTQAGWTRVTSGDRDCWVSSKFLN